MKKIPKNYRLHPKLVEVIEIFAKYSNWSNTAVVEQALRYYFHQYKKEHPDVGY